MKHLKSYNLFEELKSTTYRSAGDKFTNIGHKRRGAQLLDYATKVELREKSEKLLQAQNENKEFGTFDITMLRGWGDNKREIFSGKFYLQMCLESDWFRDQFSDWLYEGMDWSIGIATEFAIIPADDETLKMIETSEDKDIEYFRNNSMWGDDYRYWSNRLWITLCGPNAIPLSKAGVGGFEDRDGFSFYFNSRSEAMRFKKLLSDTLEGKTNWSSWGDNTVASGLKAVVVLDEEDWREKLMSKFIPRREDEYEVDNPDTWPKNPFTEDAYKRAIDAVKGMSVNGLYLD